MAIAPVNKFITIAVPVAPGEQVIYATPTGRSSIILYAQVSNVAVASTFPKVSFTHRRKTNKTGYIRNNRIIKEAKVPPNDSLIIIDGRLVLQRDAIISDSVVIVGVQSGICSITNCLYDFNTGITTITTLTNHNFSQGSDGGFRWQGRVQLNTNERIVVRNKVLQAGGSSISAHIWLSV